MKTEQHTVTIPAEDYIELMKAKDLIGIKHLNKGDNFYESVMQAIFKTVLEINPLADLKYIEEHNEIYYRNI